MRINHRGFYAFVPQQFLDGEDILSPFKQIGGRGVAEYIRGNMFVDFCRSGYYANCFLYGSRADMKAMNNVVRFSF